jgi:hypothetical protein
MRTCHTNLARKMGVSLAAAVVLATGSVHAQQGPVSSGSSAAQNETQAEAQAAAILTYWTPERM